MRKKWICGISAVCLILLLPFFNWIRVVNLVDLFSRIGVTKDMAADLLTGYNLYNLLSFVQYANQGVLGLFAMVLLILAAAAIYFNVAFIIRTIFGLKKGKGELSRTLCSGADVYASGYRQRIVLLYSTGRPGFFRICLERWNRSSGTI